MSSDSSDIEINEDLMPRPAFLADDAVEYEAPLALNELETAEELEQKLLDQEHSNKLLNQENHILQENFNNIQGEVESLREELLQNEGVEPESDLSLHRELIETEESISFYQQENASMRAKAEYEQEVFTKLTTQVTDLENKLSENDEELEIQKKKADEAQQKQEQYRQQQTMLVENLQFENKELEVAAEECKEQQATKAEALDELNYKLEETLSDNSVKEVHIQKLVHQLDQEKAEVHRLQLKLEVAGSGSDELEQIMQKKLNILRRQLEEGEREAEDQLEKNRSAIRERDSRLNDEMQEISKLEADLQDAQGKLVQTEEKMEQLIVQLQDNAELVNQAVEDHENQLKEQQQTIQELESENKRLHETASTDAVAKSTCDIGSSNLRSVAFLKTELSTAKIENFELKSRIEELENDILQERTQLQRSEVQFGAMDVERMRAQLIELSSAKAIVQDQINQLADFRRQNSEYEEQITELTQKLAHTNASMQENERTLESKDKQINELSNNLDELFAENEAAMEAETSQFESILDDNLRLKNELHTVRRQLDITAQELTGLEKETEVREQQIIAHDIDFQAQLSAFAAERAQCAEVPVLREELAEFREEIAARDAEILKLQEAVENAERAEGEIAVLCEKLNAAEERANSANRSATENEELAEELRRQISAQHERYQDLQQMAQEAETELLAEQRENEQLREAAAESGSECQSELEGARGRLEKAGQENAALRADYRALENELQQEKYNLVGEIEQFNEFKQQMQNEIKIVTQNAQILQRENEKLRHIHTSIEDK